MKIGKFLALAVGFSALLTLTLSLFALTGTKPSLAANPKSPADYNGLNKGKSDIYHLYLYEKNPDWSIAEDGAWGKMTFGTESFVFNGHKLTPGGAYSLINYVDPWPGSASVLLSSGIADAYGDIHLSGDATDLSGKVWLVLSSDFTEGTGMIGWHQAEYLFEYNVIN